MGTRSSPAPVDDLGNSTTNNPWCICQGSQKRKVRKACIKPEEVLLLEYLYTDNGGLKTDIAQFFMQLSSRG
jgi:hypothetical protein